MRVGVFYFPTDYVIIDDALLEIPDLSRDEILQLLDRYAPLAVA
jgi:hypothetical protein